MAPDLCCPLMGLYERLGIGECTERRATRQQKNMQFAAINSYVENLELPLISTNDAQTRKGDRFKSCIKPDASDASTIIAFIGTYSMVRDIIVFDPHGSTELATIALSQMRSSLGPGLTVSVKNLNDGNFDIKFYETNTNLTANESVMISLISEFVKKEGSITLYLSKESEVYASILQEDSKSMWSTSGSSGVSITGSRASRILPKFYAMPSSRSNVRINAGRAVVEIALPASETQGQVNTLTADILNATTKQGERPYGTSIFPYAASALSYDSDVQRDPTPSVHFLALEISSRSALEYNTIRDWFRDSWKYLQYGILALNICTLRKFMDTDSEYEISKLNEFIRDIINVSLRVSSKKIQIYALGNPASHSASRIRSSVSGSKKLVQIHRCRNPAALQHHTSDLRSHKNTILKSHACKALSGLITETFCSTKLLEPRDFFRMSSGMSSDHAKLISASKSMSGTFGEIESYFKRTGGGKTIEKDEDLFRKAREEMSQFVLALQGTRIQLLFASVQEPGSTAKNAYYNTRQDYNKAKYNTGSSSKAASNTTPGRKTSIGFASSGDPDEQEGSTSKDSPITDTFVPTPPVSGVGSDAGSTVSTPPIKMRKSASVTQSIASKRSTSVPIGFADDITEETELPEPPLKPDTRSESLMTADEVADMSYVSDFLEGDEGVGVEDFVKAFIGEAVRTKQALALPAQEVLKIIRDSRLNPKLRTIESSLGYVDGIVDMPSPIMQWIRKHSV
ncbi:MAG: hypothetical protein Q9187_001232 [Circinaria calcarea]